MQHQTGKFTGLSNTTIFTQQWLPDQPPRAAVILSHGIGEHSGRYAHAAAYFTQQGYAVYALDHRGHGQSAGPRVHVEHFSDFVDDLNTYFEFVRASHPKLPIFVYGHSMGSLISLLFAFRRQDELAGLITTGTALKIVGANAATVAATKSVARVLPHVRLMPLDPVGISRDQSVVQGYRDDPLVFHGKITMQLLAEMSRASADCVRQMPTLRLPYLALHGSADPLCSPDAADIIRAQCASPDKTVKVYDGLYHEIHNEAEQGDVFSDITRWIDAHLSLR